jgi:hypothetical protein
MKRDKPHSRCRLGGVYRLIVRGADGSLLADRELPNGVVDEALDHVLGVLFQSASQVDPWYIGLIDDSGFTNLANGDTLASHGGWSEFTGYTGSRPEFVDGAVASGQVDNTGTKATFGINASGDVRGVFLCSAASGTVGTLLSTAVAAPVAVASEYSVEIAYTFSADQQ